MLNRGLKAVGGAVAGAGVYGFCLYDLSFLTAAICLLVGLTLIGLGIRVEPASSSDGGVSGSRQR